MASSNSQGDVALWDLEAQKCIHVIKGAHDASVHTLEFIPSQPLLITSASDNSIKEWVFDESDLTPRLLRSKSGHHQPPNRVRFYGKDGQAILSSGGDRSLRYFCTIRDAQNTELSQGRIESKAKQYNMEIDELKFPQILQMSTCKLSIKFIS